MKRQEGLSPKDLAEIDTVAKEIGEAAVGLSNPKDRGKYDQKVAAWEAKERAAMYAQQGWRPKERVRKGW